jgi:hypothetical protein
MICLIVERRITVLRQVITGKNNDLDVRISSFDSPGEFKAIYIRQLDVHKDKVGKEGRDFQ